MAWSNGVYSRLYSWVTDRDNAVKVRADRMDGEFDELVTALNALTSGGVSHIAAMKGYSGTVLLPGYSFDGDLNSGFYRIGADNVGIAVNGTKIVDVDTVGVEVAGTLDASKGADVASAATLDLDTATGMFPDITGTTTVTAVTLSAGKRRLGVARGALQFTASASLVVNGSATTNYTTTAGDLLFFEGYASSVVRVWTVSGGSSEATWQNATQPINLSIAVSVAANALTIAAKGHDGNDPSSSNKVYVPFRSGTANSGDTEVLTLTAAASLTVSSGSTLGTSNGVAATLLVVAFNDGGTFRLGVINPTTLPVKDGIASSTAEGGAGAADTANTIYTGAAVTSKAMRVLCAITITEATAGTWASAPTTVQVGNDASIALQQQAGQLMAWLNYNGVTNTIRGSGNISSVTDNGAGDYTLNFTTPMPDANYSAVGAVGNIGSSARILSLTTAFSAASLRIGAFATTTFSDMDNISVAVFR